MDLEKSISAFNIHGKNIVVLYLLQKVWFTLYFNELIHSLKRHFTS